MSRDVEERVSTGSQAVLYVCKHCRAVRRAEYTYTTTTTTTFMYGQMHQTRRTTYVDAAGRPHLQALESRRCPCGHWMEARPVRGTYSAGHKCDSRCVNARGGDCECQCAGANHGTGHPS